MEPSGPPQPAGESTAKPSHTWLGLGLVVVSLALIVSTVDIATLLDGGLGGGTDAVAKQPVASPKAEASAQPSQAARAVRIQSVRLIPLQAILTLITRDLFGPSRPSRRRPLKALAEYRLSPIFGVKAALQMPPNGCRVLPQPIAQRSLRQ